MRMSRAMYSSDAEFCVSAIEKNNKHPPADLKHFVVKQAWPETVLVSWNKPNSANLLSEMCVHDVEWTINGEA